MCDDFFDDNFEDSFNDPSNDIEDDLFDDGDWYEDTDSLVDESADNTSPASSDKKVYDHAEALIFGSMIVGNAYEEAMDRKHNQDLIRRRNNK